MFDRLGIGRALLIAGATGCFVAGRSPAPENWLDRGPHVIEHRFRLPPGSVRFDTVTPSLDSIIGGDSTAYYVWTVAGGRSWRELKHDPARRDRRPDLYVYFEWPAVSQLGYLQGRVASLDPYAQAIWQTVPKDFALRFMDVLFICQSEGCGGTHYVADSIDRVWDRRGGRIAFPIAKCYGTPTSRFSFGDTSYATPTFFTTMVLDRSTVGGPYTVSLIEFRNRDQGTVTTGWTWVGDSMELRWHDGFTSNTWRFAVTDSAISGRAGGDTDQLVQQKDTSYAPAPYQRRLWAPRVKCPRRFPITE